MKKISVAGAAFAAFLMITCHHIGAQTATTGDLAGQVTDPVGATIPGATITLKSLDSGGSQTAQSTSAGTYRFSLLKPGRYSLTEEGAGMTAAITSIVVSVGRVTQLDVVAHPSSSAVTVEVQSTGALLQTEDANLTTNFSAAMLNAMPLPGGDLANVPFTAPGINLSTGAGYGSFTAFGLPATSNLFTTNGNDTMDPYNNLNNSGASNLTLGANEVSEAAVINNAYTGQYGRMAGAQVNFTTKSGGNQFHGNALYYYNGDFLNANDWFNKHDPTSLTPRPHAVSNQWAGSIGGPILKDRLFFFFDIEGLRYVLPGGGPVYVPSPAFQAAVTSNIAAQNPGESSYYKSIFNIYNGSSQASRAVAVSAALDPALGCGDFDGTTVGGTTFGTGGTPCANTFQNTAGSLNTEALYSLRIDQNLGGKDKLSYRYKHDYGVQATGTDPLNPAFNANSSQPEWEGQLTETHIFSPNLVNNFIASGLYYSAIFGPTNLRAALGVFPSTVSFSDGLGFSNVGGTDYNYPQGRNVAQYQIVDDVSYTRGRHTIRFGGNLRRNNITDFRAGVLTSGRTSFLSNTDFFNGTLGYNSGSFVQQRFAAQREVPIATYTLGFYLQDQIAVSNSLKLTASLRMDRNANPVCRTNCFARLNAPFDTLTHDASATGNAVPYNASIQTGLTSAFPDSEPILIQPRFGFAQTLSTKTVVRGGVGYFSDLIPAQLVDNFILNAPNVTSFTVRNNGAASANINVIPGTTDATSGYNIAASSDAALRSGFVNGATYSGLRAATANRFSAPTYNAIVSKLKNPMYVEWNLELQQALTKHDVLEVNYVGNYGYNILQNNALVNAHASGGLANFGGISSAVVDRRFSTVTQLTNMGHSDYNGVTASVRHEMGYGFTAQVNYTYSHNLDTVSNGGLNGFDLLGDTVPLGNIDPFSNRLNYGDADYDLKHSLSLNYLWRIPGETHVALLNVFTRGWTLSGTFYDRSGYPFSVVNTKTPGNYLAGLSGGVILAGYKGGGEAPCENGNSKCLLTTQFATSTEQPAYGFGNLTRNSFRAPGYLDTDTSLLKTTKVGEKVELRVGANLFNILNHPNFYKPTNDVTSGSFGVITTTVTPPSSIYGSFTGSAVSGRIIQVQGGISF